MMLSLKHDNLFKKSYKRYMKKQGRVNFQLKEIIQLLKFDSNFQVFKIILNETTDMVGLLKILMVINRYLIEIKENQDQIFQILRNLKFKYANEFEQLLFKKLVQPYRLYLQKRSILELDSTESIGKKLNKQANTYQLLNILCLGTSFSDILYIFGRYYLNKMNCIIDFNITLGADIQYIYKIMVQNIVRPAPKIILQQLELIHQKLYVVFYNCYFHKYLKNYVPKWVVTDISFQSPRKSSSNFSTRSNSYKKQNTSVRFQKNKSASRFQLKKTKQKGEIMGQSFLFLKGEIDEIQENIQNQQQNDKIIEAIRKKQQGFKLLYSMERCMDQLKLIQ